MKWYRLLKSSDDGTTVTVPSGITLAITDAITAASGAISGTFGVSGIASFVAPVRIVGTRGTIATGASPDAYKVMTIGNYVGTAAGATCQIWTLYGAPSQKGPTPAYVGDILIDTLNGKLYIASAVTAYSDFKLVTSA